VFFVFFVVKKEYKTTKGTVTAGRRLLAKRNEKEINPDYAVIFVLTR